jgi:hypothetical protein
VQGTVCVFPILEEVLQEVLLGDPDSIEYAQEIEDLYAPSLGRGGLLKHIAEEYCVNAQRMMYGDVKRFQSKLLGFRVSCYWIEQLSSAFLCPSLVQRQRWGEQRQRWGEQR